jgi:hypothetical protein
VPATRKLTERLGLPVAEFAVIDHGCGVPPEHRASLFHSRGSGLHARAGHPGLFFEPVEHRANGVLCVLPDLVTRLALDENLLARSRILGKAGENCEDSGSEHENETAHPTVSMADKEYARANRGDYFANWLRSKKRCNRPERSFCKTRLEKSAAIHEHTFVPTSPAS